MIAYSTLMLLVTDKNMGICLYIYKSFDLLKRSILHSQAGFDPPSAESQTSTECKFDTFTLQATTAGQPKQFFVELLFYVRLLN